jgi:hypothetical protein
LSWLIELAISKLLFKAEGTYTVQDEVMSITDGAKDVLEGYPDASLFDYAAIDYCNNTINDAIIQTKNYLMALYINIVS